ncbi:MAG: B12-binding domain-containing radical SAM protein [Deltaproteobacteria bacterium]|nr:B12-binding domain-containing radical SAM protein [Deltaproteobacteria bacterium]
MSPKIILIHPPVAKCSEPPAGIAKLSSCLNENGISNDVIDANLEGILFLLKHTSDKNTTADRWTTRAIKNLERNLAALRNIDTYQNQSRYQRAVMDINHLLNVAAKSWHVDLSLADYHDQNLSPVKSSDLISAAEKPQANPFYPYFQNRLMVALESNPDFIGFSMNYLSQALCTFAMIGFIKQIQQRQKIILGGSLITSWIKLGARKNIFRGLVDYMVEGAGEKKLLEILNVKNGSNNSPPDYDGFPLNKYLSPGLILPYSAARGCYWHKCAFCPEKAEGNAYLPLEVSKVTEELQILNRQTNPSLIHILDSSISPSLLGALAQSPPGEPWYGFTRITKHLADEDFCLSLKRSGCAMLKLGIESGDQRVLDQLNKGIDLSTASAILKTLKKSGIAVYCYFLLGTPPENEESALKTMDFVARHHECIDFLNLAIFNLPSRSVEARSLSTHDFYEGDLSLYKNFQHPLGWQRSAVRNFLEKTFKKHPAIVPVIRRTPEFFTSNHAPFFVRETPI